VVNPAIISAAEFYNSAEIYSENRNTRPFHLSFLSG